jgi:hypothetical protein
VVAAASAVSVVSVLLLVVASSWRTRTYSVRAARLAAERKLQRR